MAKSDLQALLNKAKDMREAPKTKVVRIGGVDLEIKRLPTDKYYDLQIGLSRKLGDGAELAKVQIAAVFDACPMLHDRQLLEACECSEPYDVVEKVFTPDEIIEIVGYIVDFDDNKRETVEEALKN